MRSPGLRRRYRLAGSSGAAPHYRSANCGPTTSHVTVIDLCSALVLTHHPDRLRLLLGLVLLRHLSPVTRMTPDPLIHGQAGIHV